MPETLRRFIALYKLEVRLTCWQPIYALLVAVWSIFIISQYANGDLFSMFSMLFAVIGFISLIALFLTGVVAGRAKRSRFDLMEVALPYGAEAGLARWLASLTAVGGFIVVPLIILLFLPSTLLDPGFAPHMILLILLSATFTSGLVWLVQNTIGIRRWMYPLFAGVWLLGGMLPSTLHINGLPIPGLQLTNFIRMEAPTQSLWGALPQGSLPGYFALFYIGIIALFVGVTLWRAVRRRSYRLSVPSVALMAASLGVMAFAGVNYGVREAALNQEILDNQDREGAVREEQIAPADVPYVVTDYAVTFSAPSAVDQPAHLTASLIVLNRGDAPLTALNFSLNHQFIVTSVSGESAYVFDRSADQIVVHLPKALEPGTAQPITFAYEGSIWVTQYIVGQPPEATDFTAPNGISLNGGTLWYPVPGRFAPNAQEYVPADPTLDPNDHAQVFRLIDYTFLDQPATFNLTIDPPGDLDYTSNLPQIDDHTFASQGTRWANLIGAPELQSTTANGVTVVGAARGFDLIEPSVRSHYEPYIAYLRSVFPAVDAESVIVLAAAVDPPFFSTFPATQEAMYTILPPHSLSWLERNPQNEYDYVGDDMVSSLFGDASSPLTENVAFFLWTLRSGGGVEAMQSILTNGLPTGSGGSTAYYAQPFGQRYTIANALFSVYLENGEEEALDTVREMYAERLTLSAETPDAIVKWVQARQEGTR